MPVYIEPSSDTIRTMNGSSVGRRENRSRQMPPGDSSVRTSNGRSHE
jgi:hypothetical protein